MKQEWISVKTPPKSKQQIICVVKDGKDFFSICGTYWDGVFYNLEEFQNGRIPIKEREVLEDVVFWMPLPSPPQTNTIKENK